MAVICRWYGESCLEGRGETSHFLTVYSVVGLTVHPFSLGLTSVSGNWVCPRWSIQAVIIFKIPPFQDKLESMVLMALFDYFSSWFVSIVVLTKVLQFVNFPMHYFIILNVKLM